MRTGAQARRMKRHEKTIKTLVSHGWQYVKQGYTSGYHLAGSVARLKTTQTRALCAVFEGATYRGKQIVHILQKPLEDYDECIEFM